MEAIPEAIMSREKAAQGEEKDRGQGTFDGKGNDLLE
jgi:hypothetical protein